MLRPEVQAVVDLGRMPIDDLTSSVAEAEAWEAALEALPLPLTKQESISLLDSFPVEGSYFGLAWSLLHAIEHCPENRPYQPDFIEGTAA